MGWMRVLRRRKWDDERRRELESYLDIETDANIARGLDPVEARTRAHRTLGNPTLIREEIYRMNSMTRLESIWHDLRYGGRALRKNVGFAAVALLSLALGIGANAAIFQLLDVIRLRALPVHDPAAIVEIHVAPNQTGRTGSFRGSRPALTNPLWERIRDETTTVQDLFAYGAASFELADGGESRPVLGLFVSGRYFSALEAGTAAGRLLGPQDDVRGCASPAAVASYGFWRRELGGVTDLSGVSIRLDGHTLPVVGVVARGFTGMEIGRRVDVFVPLCARPFIRPSEPDLDARDLWWLAAFGRLRPDTTVEQATAELASLSPGIFADTVSPRYEAADVKAYLGFQLMAESASTGVSTLRTRYATSLALLLGIAALVFLIACANLANLMLARGSARAREIAVRLALGASRPRLFRQLIAESLLLAALGGAAGVGLALVLSRVLVSVITGEGSPWALDVEMDWRLVGFTVVLAAVGCVTFGLAPAWRAARSAPGVAANLGGRGLTTDGRRLALRRALVVGQMAVSLVLVVGALLFVGTLRNLANVDSGFSDRGVLVVDLDLRPVGLATDAQLPYQAALVERLSHVPGVEAGGSAAIVPLGGSGWNETVLIEGVRQEGHPNANRVSAGYFDALRIPVRAGRVFDARDRADSPPVVMVDEAFVERYLPGGSPLGRTIRLVVGPEQPDLSYEVIGVVGNTKYSGLRDPVGPQMYFVDAQEPTPLPYLTVLLRAAGDPDALRPAVARAVADVNPAIVIAPTVMSRQLDSVLVRERLMAMLSSGFAALAVVLAAVGLYGLMAYAVARRRHEIGIRMALGATRGRIVSMLVREVAILVAVGVVVGLAGALAAARAAATLLFGLTASNPVLLAVSAIGLAAVAGIASIVPASRAAATAPTIALKDEG